VNVIIVKRAGVRNVRTKEQKINDLKAKLAKVKSDMRDETRKARDKRSIIIGASLEARASKDADAKKLLDEIIDGLVRPQDRTAFGLDPLPKPDAAAGAPAAQPTGTPSVAEIDARISRAVKAWNDGPKSPQDRDELRDAIIAMETVTGVVGTTVKPDQRRGFGLGDRPGERL
jgi:hypothetical protein